MLEISKIAQVTGHKGSIFALQHVDGQHFLTGGGEGWIVKWNMDTPDPGKLIAKVESNIFSLYTNGGLIIVGDMHGGMHWIDPMQDKSVDLQHHKRGIFRIWEQNEFIYALGGDGYLSKRPINDSRAVESIQISHQSLRSFAVLPNGSVVIGSSDGNIYFVDTVKMSVLNRIDNAHNNSVFTIQFDHVNNRIWTGGRDAQIKIWTEDGQPLHTIPSHMYTVNTLTFDPTQQLMFSGSRDKTIKVWDANSFELLKVIDGIRDGGHLNSVNCLLWSPVYECLISGSDDKSFGLWKIIKK